MSDPDRGTDPAHATDAADTDVPELRAAQRDIREAFFAHDAGLFVLDCNPGAGKSTVAERIAAETLVRAHHDGERAPERRLCVTSFARDDAAAIQPGVENALHALADRDDAPVDVTPMEARTLARRLRRSDTLGTIDSVLRTVFADVATEVGFAEVPSVGNDALLATVREDCLAALRDDPEHAARVRRLDTAYPGGEYTDGLDDLLVAALRAVRERRLTVDAFETRLAAAIDDAYPQGAPADFAAVVRDIAAFVDDGTAEQTAAAFDEADEAAFLAADRACHDAWREAVADFCTLLGAFEARYDALTRERGVVSHLDAAHWVATYFRDDAYASDYRESRRAHYAARLRTLVIDEAQDVAVVQHDALAPFVDSDTRVLLVGDVKQSIYTWRNAHPELFERAFDDGDYFGVDWETHVRERADRTYRARPDVAAAVDAVFADVLTDPERGNAGALTLDYPPLVPERDPLDDPSVHVAAYGANGRPGTSDWAADEADHLATYLAGALTDGTFETDDSADSPGITVLFHRRTHMDTFADALERRGVSVANASQHLFAHPLVRLVVAVLRWLADPFDPDHTARTLDVDAVPTVLAESLADLDWDVRAAADGDVEDDGVATVLAGLAALATRRARHASDSGALVVEDIVERLSLAADPLDQTADDAPGRRVAALDALLEHVADWEGDDRYSPPELADLLGRYADTPTDGPTVPVPDSDAHDVVFRTIYQMKGAEDDVVVLADLGTDLGFHGPHRDVFLARGDHLALAPPADVDTGAPSIHGFDGGVYSHPEHDTGDGDRRDAGLRWASERWVDMGRLAGPPALRAAAGDHRAERWRLLYVAATRARDHLVFSLPRERPPERRRPRDYWMDALLEGLDLTDLSRGTRTHDCAGRGVDIDVNHVSFVDRVATSDPVTTPHAATRPDDAATGWTPRYVNASTLYPLATHPDTFLLDHLQGNALHTERESPADRLPLSFDGYGPDAVGTVAHDVLTTAVSQGVDTETLRACRGPLASRLNAALDDVPDAARDELRAFVTETVCPQFAATETWARLRESDPVYVEEPLDAVVHVDGFAIETQNVADVVSRDSTGQWHVDDLKLALAPSDAETRARYALQTATYAWVFERQSGHAAVSVVTRLGVDPDIRRVSAPNEPVAAWFDALPDLR
ncbi:UvrD-helicase domain-containing protein [Halarchaeum sp. P4]|uniref:UvrD-helicase domain-containing protein n=1 Tax=Halarchaeum sp. P4 TaxID=3421639 RepID=UPI003EBF04AB